MDRTADDPRLAARGRARADRSRSPWWSWWSSCSCATAAPTLIPERRRAGLADRHLRRDVSGRLQPRNLSLMALTIATGFVVDDAIVVLENIIAAHRGRHGAARGGAAGRARSRLHRAVDEPVADRGVHSDPADGRHRRPPVPRIRGHAVGGDPGLAGGLADHDADDVRAPAAAAKPSEQPRRGCHAGQRARLRRAAARLRARSPGRCGHGLADDAHLLATVALNVYLYIIVPKGFFPQQDTGRLIGSIQADQSISFQAMQEKLADFVDIVSKDPAVDTVVGFTGGGQRNSGPMFIVAEAARRAQDVRRSGDRAPARQAREGARREAVPAVPVQDIRVGGRQSTRSISTRCRPTTWTSCATWEPQIRKRCRSCRSWPMSTPTSRTRACRPRW